LGANSRFHLYWLSVKLPACLPAVAPPGRLLGKGRLAFPFSQCRFNRGRSPVIAKACLSLRGRLQLLFQTGNGLHKVIGPLQFLI
jgi:hypothetical protein